MYERGMSNDLVVEKRVVINDPSNPGAAEGHLSLQVEPETYQEITAEFFDSHTKQRMQLTVEVYLCRQPFLDESRGKYSIRIPPLRRSMTHSSMGLDSSAAENNEVSIEVLLHQKDRKDNKATVVSNTSQSLQFRHRGFSDSIAVSYGAEDGMHGYDTILNCLQARADVFKGAIGWIDESPWWLGVLTLSRANFYFLIKC